MVIHLLLHSIIFLHFYNTSSFSQSYTNPTPLSIHSFSNSICCINRWMNVHLHLLPLSALLGWYGFAVYLCPSLNPFKLQPSSITFYNIFSFNFSFSSSSSFIFNFRMRLLSDNCMVSVYIFDVIQPSVYYANKWVKYTRI